MSYEDNDLVEVACEVKATTDNAMLIYDGSVTEWVPRSQVFDSEENDKGQITSVWISQWIANKKGFI